MTAYVYIPTEPGLWTVGFYRPDGRFEPDSDHDSRAEAGDRVAYLNGGGIAQTKLIHAVKIARQTVRFIDGYDHDARSAADFVQDVYDLAVPVLREAVKEAEER